MCFCKAGKAPTVAPSFFAGRRRAFLCILSLTRQLRRSLPLCDACAGGRADSRAAAAGGVRVNHSPGWHGDLGVSCQGLTGKQGALTRIKSEFVFWAIYTCGPTLPGIKSSGWA